MTLENLQLYDYNLTFSCKYLPEIEQLRLEIEEVIRLGTDDPSGRPETYMAHLGRTWRRQAS